MGEDVLDIRKLIYGFPNLTWEVRNFKVRKGAVLGFFGPNGEGKSTFINAILGSSSAINYLACDYTLRTDSPEGVRVNSSEIRNPSSRTGDSLEQVRLIGSSSSIPGFLTVRETLNLIRIMNNAEESEVEVVIKRLRLTKYLDVLVQNLSTGNRQKVNLASVFMGKIPLRILDEPFLGLDIEMREIVKIWIVELSQSEDPPTWFIITHEFEEIATELTHISIIKEGKIYSPIDNVSLSNRVLPLKFTVHCPREKNLSMFLEDLTVNQIFKDFNFRVIKVKQNQVTFSVELNLMDEQLVESRCSVYGIVQKENRLRAYYFNPQVVC